MLTLTHVEKLIKTGALESEQSIGWVLDGNAFVIRDKDQFCTEWLPIFFGQAKFSSFTRKLYRWGFRKVNITQQHARSLPENAYFFGNEYFRRDDKARLSQMRSITAAKTRSERAHENKRKAIKEITSGQSSVSSAHVPQQHQQQQHALPMNFPAIPALSLIQAPTFNQAGISPQFQASLLQTMNLVDLQLKLSAAQAGTLVSPPIDLSQLLTTIMNLSRQNATSASLNQMLSQFPSNSVAATRANPVTAFNQPAQSWLNPPSSLPQLTLPFFLPPVAAAPAVSQSSLSPQTSSTAAESQQTRFPGFTISQADQERLLQAIQILVNNTNASASGGTGPSNQQQPPS